MRTLLPVWLAATLLILACAPEPPAGGGPWKGDAAIALARSFGSPVGFTCLVAWDLRNADAATVADLTIELRLPAAVQDLLVATTPGGQPLAQPWPRYDEWRTWANDERTGAAALDAMAQRKHIVGASGIPCSTQQATSAMRGAEVRIRWKADGAMREQLIGVGDVRSWVRLSRDANGEPLIDWLATEQ